ncbi:potassium channel protein [Ramlibacter sp.]|uniref:potassium channel family protein n=1 Tax=Ramlibacter sp. TaxID=1917967 RepID=UPI0025E1B6FD|nr:potassium channel protein [Ramlibacter sp.]
MNKVFRSRHFRGLATGAVVLLAVLAAGTLGYHVIGAPTATWVDSFYMTFITVATIGYHEVVDLSAHPGGRLFTAMRGHYIVCGIGRVGGNVARELLRTRRPFVAIEADRAALDRWPEGEPGTLHLHADAADDDALRRAGVAQAAGVFAVTGDDSHNLMIALSVKLLNPQVRVVARLHDVRKADKARRAGADEIVSPDFTGGMRIASAMVRPHVVNFMDQMLRSDEALRVEEVVVPPRFAGRALSRLLPKSREYMVMATHEQGRWVFNPPDDHLVQQGAVILLMTSPQGRAAVEKMLAAAP